MARWTGRGCIPPGGGAESGGGDSDGHVGASEFAGIGYGECGDADGDGDVTDYCDGYGSGWGSAWGCGDADRAVEQSAAECCRAAHGLYGRGRPSPHKQLG
jgi:hypothetical protein